MNDNKQPIIALVEDEEMDVRHFKRLARKHGLNNPILVFENGDQAFAYLQECKADRDHPPVLLLTDLNMPGITGQELIEAVRKDKILANLVVFVVSTSDLQSDINRAYANKVAGYIVKDSAGTSLAESIQMLRHYCSSVRLPGYSFITKSAAV